MEILGAHLVHVVQVYQHDIGIVTRGQHALVVGQAQHGGGAGAHQKTQQFQRQALLTAKLGVAYAEGCLQAHHTGGSLLLFLGGMGCVVGADAGHGAVLDGFDQGGDVVGLADGRVDLVLKAAVIEPEVMGRDLAADTGAFQAAHADGVDGFLGGDVAHVQAGAVVLGQVAVAHGLDILSQAVVPGADLPVLGVGHDGQAALGGDGKDPRHNGIVHHAVAVLGDELDVLRQGKQMVDGLAVKVLGDGDGLVGIAQADALGLGFHRVGDLRRGADRLGVGHQVHKGVTACRCGRRAGGDVLFIFKAWGAPVAVGIDESGQDGAAFGIQHILALGHHKALADGCDLVAAQPYLDGFAGGVFCVADQHVIPPWVCIWAKKNFSQKWEKSKSHTMHSGGKGRCAVDLKVCKTAHQHADVLLPHVLHKFYLLYHAPAVVSMQWGFLGS